ncbi:MAG: ABC transporter substrate-binding protein [Proteobacteria bacterium]|nr:ABC transporter substrate-binding protein [Pseudomonadota bacterium]
MTARTLIQHLFAAAALMSSLAATAQAPSTLKVVLDGEIKIVDPIATVNYRTRDLAYMVFDMLIATDSKGNYKPQMLESFAVSRDRMRYTFTLRPGLEFSDGAPVTAEDCVASIKRWAARDGLGGQMMASTKALKVVDKSTFTLELAKPFGYVIEAIGKPSSNVLAIMPARIASLDASKPISELVGSGPFVFRKDLWVAGNKMVLEKNKRYRPRPEPADGLAGGKQVHIDRLELLVMPDPATKVAALQVGEVDYVQQVPFDFMPILKSNKEISLSTVRGIGDYLAVARPNHAQPPFNNLKVRQALQVLVDQPQVLAGLGAIPELMTECHSVYSCSTKYKTNAGTDSFRQPNLERAKALLKEAGYKGEKVVVLHTTDVQTIHLLSTVLEEQMRKAGFNVEVQAADWATVSQRRFNKEVVEKGGWSLLPNQWFGFDVASPLTHYGIAYNCTNGYPGWSCDEETTRLLAQFTAEMEESKRQALADKLQVRAHESVSIVVAGQYTFSNAYRSNLKGLLAVGIPVFWNVEKVSAASR